MSGAHTPIEVRAELDRRLDHKSRRKGSDGSFGEFLAHVPQIVCVSGLRMSVQASAYHYCSPRESEGPWYNVEVGFPSERVEALMEWMEDWGDTQPTDAVYGYVPIGVVAQVIADNGGFAEEATTAIEPNSVGTPQGVNQK